MGKNKGLEFKRQAIKAAKDFGYEEKYIEQIKKEKNPDKINGIMETARKRFWKGKESWKGRG